LNISGTREDVAEKETSFFFIFKGLSFYFIGTLKTMLVNNEELTM